MHALSLSSLSNAGRGKRIDMELKVTWSKPEVCFWSLLFHIKTSKEACFWLYNVSEFVFCLKCFWWNYLHYLTPSCKYLSKTDALKHTWWLTALPSHHQVCISQFMKHRSFYLIKQHMHIVLKIQQNRKSFNEKQESPPHFFPYSVPFPKWNPSVHNCFCFLSNYLHISK